MSATHITPTIGRKLWYFPSSYDTIEQGPDQQPLDATVCYVWPDGTVNLAVHDWHGYPWTRSRVNLVQEGGVPPSNAGYATWMPFQVAQAAKAVETVSSHGVLADGVLTARKLAEAGIVATAQTGEPQTDQSAVETKAYPDGTVATGTAPLPDQSPAEQAAKQPAEAPAPSQTVADKALPTTTTKRKR